MGRILIAMHGANDSKVIANIVRGSGMSLNINICETGAEVLRVANDRDYGVVVCEQNLRDTNYTEIADMLPNNFGMVVLTKDHSIEIMREDMVKLIFVPCYLDGNDGVMNINYYDVIIGKDLSVYPSYYEPWGYTPLESVAFHVPCVTTSLSGFGMWANSEKGSASNIMDGVEVIRRTDYNYSEVADRIKETLSLFSSLSAKEIEEVRTKAKKLSDKALWKNFIKYYYNAYDIALTNRNARLATTASK